MNNFESLENYLQNRRRIVMSVWAGTGVGKSYFALTAPKPVYFLSLEPEGAYWSMQNALESELIKAEDIKVNEIIRSALGTNDIPLVRNLSDEVKIYRYMKSVIEDVVSEGDDNGTLVIDTGTTWNHMMQEVEMEEINRKRKAQGRDLFPFDYRYANKAMKSSLDAIRNSNLNCVITHHGQAVYNAKGEKTQRTEYSGNNQLPQWVDVQIQLKYDVDTKERFALIEKCRVNVEKIGEDVDNPTFDNVLNAIGV
tara:strand:+ start:7191 stop:7949 length:759 start_codon:yes stop_codon:yes gene_type:complete